MPRSADSASVAPAKTPRPEGYPREAPWPLTHSGIAWDKARQRFEARVRHEGRTVRLGRFERLGDARKAIVVASGKIASETFTPPAEIRRQRREDAAAQEAAEARAALTLREYAGTWLARPISERGLPLAPASIADYRSVLNRHVLPTLGDRPLADVTRTEVTGLLDTLGQGQRVKAGRTVRALLRAAVKAGHEVQPDALADVKTPKAGKRATVADGTVLTPAEVAAIAAEMPKGYGPAVEVAAWCALRLGEVLGLQRDDIDVRRRVVHVRRQWASKQHPGKDHADRYAPPKDESYGDVQVFSDDFWTRLVTLVKSRPAAGDLPLFPSPAKPDQPASETWLRDHYRAAAVRAGITRPLDFHTLRHSGATWFGRTGASLAALMNFGRWRSVEPAMRYQHADAETVAYFGKRMGQ